MSAAMAATSLPLFVASLFAGSWKPTGYVPVCGRPRSVRPGASLSLVFTSHTLLGCASEKRAPGLSR